MSVFKPVFDGYMKIYLHDEIPERLANRATFVGDWVAAKRRKILKKERRFKVTLHIFDKDGHKCGLETFEFMSAGNDQDLSHAIFKVGSKFVNELASRFEVDTTNSYAVIRA